MRGKSDSDLDLQAKAGEEAREQLRDEEKG
jgi:hypothetical protein